MSLLLLTSNTQPRFRGPINVGNRSHPRRPKFSFRTLLRKAVHRK
ncbi:hypothetical protein NC99_21740 [Sunxiuqinia dokdonensis]|uniref:Uncharacterized protein n=1 Tax=Sunxiuqinia dokdonensis TaxID=1409788 RepID=A0A0L8V9D0_9BACT|nr:hypothetical protein NC99_21740 [Sunxiuqinia dokdonensis]